MGAAADCERFISAFFGQPVNSITALAFVVAGGVVVWRRADRVWVGIGLVATGVGSFLFHGPVPAGSEWAHDLTLAWLVAMVAFTGLRWERWSRLPTLAGAGALFALVPAAADPVAVLLTVVAGVMLLRRDRSLSTLGPLGLLAVSAVIGRLGSTGWPLCNPDSVLQTHGLWHLGAAAAVTWWALAPRSPRAERGAGGGPGVPVRRRTR